MQYKYIYLYCKNVLKYRYLILIYWSTSILGTKMYLNQLSIYPYILVNYTLRSIHIIFVAFLIYALSLHLFPVFLGFAVLIIYTNVILWYLFLRLVFGIRMHRIYETFFHFDMIRNKFKYNFIGIFNFDFYFHGKRKLNKKKWLQILENKQKMTMRTAMHENRH